MIRHTQKNKGITLLIAVFVSGLVLSIAMGIFGLLFGGSRFAFTAQESFSAFHAADSGLECALYWDLHFNSFATSTATSNTINCIGNSIASVGGWDSCADAAGNSSPCNFDDEPKNGFNAFTVTFSNQDAADRSCAHVTVSKIGSKTIMTSLGENICGAPSESSIQRGIQIDYRTF